MIEKRETTIQSSALLAAQAQLEAMRRERREMRVQQGLPVRTDEHGRFLSPPTPLAAAPPVLPSHLGWESDGLTAVLQRAILQRAVVQQTVAPSPASCLTAAATATRQHPAPTPPAKASTLPTTVKLYPDVALGMLRTELAAPGRIWLLLRHLDTVGNGWIGVAQARKQLAQKQAPLRVCGWRQLRNLLEQGNGIFWQQGNGRIWLRSVVKVAAALGVWRLHSRPVALSVSVLTQGMGQVRAHFYASFHSGRNRDTDPSPIARATLQEITCVHPRTQRRYEAQARVQRQHNYALGQRVNAEADKQQAWQHGHALFQFVDAAGYQGPAGATYYAWQLPNQYVGPHQPQPRSRQKRHNRELVDLLRQGTMGNSKETSTPFRQKRFYRQGSAAAKAANRGSQEIYWPGQQQHFWHFWELGDV
ncbi:MAG: hypothetical protein KC443_11225 [Anaerolineales bacterium]|nr:hypothetical protein [Anaerolineales bacterium]